MTDLDTMNFQTISSTLPANLVSILQRDATRNVMEYLHYTPNKINKTLIELGFDSYFPQNNSFVPIDPRSEVISEDNSSDGTKKATGTKGTKGKKGNKTEKKDGEKRAQSDIQVAYRTFMANNTNMDNTDGIKYKLSQLHPNMQKKELHTCSLKKISEAWKEMSAEEKGSVITNTNKNSQLKAEIIPSAVQVNSDDEDDETQCEELKFGGKIYAVEIGDEPRSVYTLEGVEVGTFTTENGVQLC